MGSTNNTIWVVLNEEGNIYPMLRRALTVDEAMIYPIIYPRCYFTREEARKYVKGLAQITNGMLNFKFIKVKIGK